MRSTIALVSVFLLTYLISGCVDFQRSPEQISSVLENRTIRKARVSFRSYTMEALAVGPSDAPPVLFIHGSPGSWDNYLDVIPNLPDLQLILFDRPGFGGSQPLESLPNLKQQANAALQVLLHFSREPAIVVGHSYGGPIALEMALQSRNQVRALVLLGASVDPELEELRWYNYLTSALDFMIPGSLVRSNDEMITVKQQLEIQKGEILNTGSEPLPPIYVMHGTEDGLVPVENVNYIYEYPGAHSNLLCIQVLQDQNHFIPWNQPVMLARMIQAAIKGECSVSMDYSHATE